MGQWVTSNYPYAEKKSSTVNINIYLTMPETSSLKFVFQVLEILVISKQIGLDFLFWSHTELWLLTKKKSPQLT